MSFINTLIYVKYDSPNIYEQVDFLNIGTSHTDGLHQKILTGKTAEDLCSDIRKLIEQYNKKLVPEGKT